MQQNFLESFREDSAIFDTGLHGLYRKGRGDRDDSHAIEARLLADDEILLHDGAEVSSFVIPRRGEPVGSTGNGTKEEGICGISSAVQLES